MLNFTIGFFTVTLVLLSVLIVTLILIQQPNKINSSRTGFDSGNLLTRWTFYFIIIFFIICFILHLIYISINKNINKNLSLPSINIEQSLPK